jgi:Leucine-rich repeat (LRR) protein
VGAMPPCQVASACVGYGGIGAVSCGLQPLLKVSPRSTTARSHLPSPVAECVVRSKNRMTSSSSSAPASFPISRSGGRWKSSLARAFDASAAALDELGACRSTNCAGETTPFYIPPPPRAVLKGRSASASQVVRLANGFAGSRPPGPPQEERDWTRRSQDCSVAAEAVRLRTGRRPPASSKRLPVPRGRAAAPPATRNPMRASPRPCSQRYRGYWRVGGQAGVVISNSSFNFSCLLYIRLTVRPDMYTFVRGTVLCDPVVNGEVEARWEETKSALSPTAFCKRLSIGPISTTTTMKSSEGGDKDRKDMTDKEDGDVAWEARGWEQTLQAPEYGEDHPYERNLASAAYAIEWNEKGEDNATNSDLRESHQLLASSSSWEEEEGAMEADGAREGITSRGGRGHEGTGRLLTDGSGGEKEKAPTALPLSDVAREPSGLRGIVRLFRGDIVEGRVHDGDNGDNHENTQLYDSMEAGDTRSRHKEEGAGMDFLAPEVTALMRSGRRRDRQQVLQPGAYHMPGTASSPAEDGANNESSESTVDTAPLVPMPPPPLAAQQERLETILIEADLVTDNDDRAGLLVEATVVRRKRQALVVGALLVVAALIAGVSVYLIQKRVEERPKARRDYELVPVANLQRPFNLSLSDWTLQSINAGSSTPQATAYRWLFASGDHPDLPQTEALRRMIHRFALATLYFSTGGNGTWRIDTNWLDKAQHECLWFGVACANRTDSAVAFCTSEFDIPSVSCRLVNGTRVVGLDLSGNQLVGSIPREIELFNASGVESILFAGNKLDGSIPSELGAIITLRTLSLAQNQLASGIPTSMGNLKNLLYLQLSRNQLTGRIPRAIATLSQLEELYLSQNQLEGGLDPSISFVVTSIDQMTALKVLDVSRNRITGWVPTELASLTKLVHLDISSNRLTQNIPSEFGSSLSSLQVLDLSDNSFSGTIPTQLGNLTSLKRLDLSYSGLNGTIPSELGKLKNLEYLLCDGDSNEQQRRIQGRIPKEIGNLRSLIAVSACSNSLTGPIPSELGRLTALERFLVEHNYLSGTIPTEFGRLTNMIVWKTSWNSLKGRLPAELGQLTALQELSFFDNALSGTIPTEFGSLTSLVRWWAFMNSLTGPLPKELGHLTDLEELIFHVNALSGTIPTEIGLLTKIVVWDTAWNSLTGPLPSEVGLLTGLERFDTSSNELAERIPTELGSLRDMAWLILGGNRLTSSIPTELKHLGKLEFLSVESNFLTGNIPTELGSLTGISILHLGRNHLTGTIPKEVARMSSITVLNVESNPLVGWIPTELGLLRQLESLSLGSTNLSGTIPTEFGSLIKLHTLSMGSSNLLGTIPTELGWLRQLEWLSMGSTNLSGTIPTELGSMLQLEWLSMFRTNLSGTIPTDLASLTKLTSLFAGFTKLSGTIPTALGSLTCLESLWVFNSALSGKIPAELGRLSQLTDARLGENRLNGTLPSDLALLTSLTSLRLEGNRLTGTIPSELARLSILVTLSLGGGNRISGSVPSQVCAMLARNRSCVADVDFAYEDDGCSLDLSIDCALVECSCGTFDCTCDNFRS